MLRAVHARPGIHGILAYIWMLTACLEDDRMSSSEYLEVLRRNTARIVNDRLGVRPPLAFSSPSPCINVWSADVDRRLSDYAPPFSPKYSPCPDLWPDYSKAVDAEMRMASLAFICMRSIGSCVDPAHIVVPSPQPQTSALPHGSYNDPDCTAMEEC